MAWTQERINLLIELWINGKSASVVAKELGNVSRNAVIGKVHRLGIANRDNIPKMQREAVSEDIQDNQIRIKINKKGKIAKKIKKIAISIPKDPLVANGSSSGKMSHAPLKLYSKRGGGEHDPNAPDFKKISLFDLKEKTCRWPSGDPKTDNFYFCGCPTEGNSPYCAYHTKVAYSQSSRQDSKNYITIGTKNHKDNDEYNDGINVDTAFNIANQESSNSI